MYWVRKSVCGVAAGCAALSFQVLTPLDAVLGEVTRVLRPGGVLVALVPSGLGVAFGLFRWWRVTRVLGIHTQPWPNPRAQDGPLFRRTVHAKRGAGCSLRRSSM
jgi:SAM-dependent methyltransferase